ncbi:metallophosphoesterase family protein [Klenkia brasiliensis]|uniref:Predicted phosphohydrolase, MPP superfamily n=1 Tax=Klenkia brasiliensis TaxID=333142 RepID=A0A1G7QM51_9ACTN|nr:metallophosphoesterase [Klenkia brasiliensis]SDF99627.1 Predicted phosphohydrolase, MPP superfamily [Klenkia brasiliensis]
MTEPADAAPEEDGTGRRRLRAVVRWSQRVVVAVVGATLGIALLGHVQAPIGPFDATVAFTPAPSGGAEVEIPPLGSLAVDAYDGPLRLDVQLRRVDQARAQALATDPSQLDGVVDRVSEDLRAAVAELAWTTAGAGVGGALVLSLVVFRRRREQWVALGLSSLLLAGTAGLGAATWRPEALSQPTYTGLLVNANSLIGSARDIVARYDAYRASLEDLVSNVSTLYSAVSTLPDPSTTGDSVTLLHVSDLHLNPAGADLVSQVVGQFDVDAVLDTGDVVDWGSPVENQTFGWIGGLGVPYVYVRGNHDSAVTAAAVAAQPNAVVLDDSSTTVAGITVAGAPDPRFTPDKDGDEDGETLEQSGEELAEYIATLDEPPAIAMVHEPPQADPLDGVVPLVLAGHTHERDVSVLEDGTRLMVEGSTGGAGLRGLQGEDPTPLSCTVLYLDPATGELTAYDEITLGGLGQSEVTIQRTYVDPLPTGDGEEPAPTDEPVQGPALPTP